MRIIIFLILTLIGSYTLSAQSLTVWNESHDYDITEIKISYPYSQNTSQDNTINSSISHMYEQSFKEFAQDFIDNGISSLSNFKSYSENKIGVIDFDKGDWTKESVSKTYNYLKYYFKFKKYKIKKSKIDFTDGEFTVTLYFRKNENGEWKLYKYDGVA